jgi:hypothetical protein
MHAHVTRQQLTARAEQCLGDDDKIQAEEHLKECGPCRERAREIQEIGIRLSANAADLAHFSCEDRVMSRIVEERSARVPEGRLLDFLKEAFLSRRVRLAGVVAVAVLAMVSVGIFFDASSQAWTIEQSIEALQGKRGVHFSGFVAWGAERLKCEMWIRGRQGGSRMEDMLLRVENGATIWVKGNATYFHLPPDPVVYRDDAQTAGISHWPGPEFLDLLRKVSRNTRVDTRFDLFSARRLVVLQAQLMDANGAKSFVMEFDPRSKMLVSLRSWNNLNWEGRPVFEADSIQYFDSPPDSLFEPGLASSAVYRLRDVSIAPEMLGLLSNPASGRSFPGLSEEEASRRIVEQVLRAQIEWDLPTFRMLAPVTSLFDDEQIAAVLGGLDGQEAIAELINVGEAHYRGRSALGPLLVVPVVARQKQGRLREHKLIVQIRSEGENFSCVVYGPHGYGYDLE